MSLKLRKIIVSIFSFLYIAGCIYAADISHKLAAGEDPFRLLEEAYVLFDQGEYGGAMALAEQARHNRKRMNDWAVYTVQYALKAPAVQAAGNDLNRIITLLRQREALDAYNIIMGLIDIKGDAFFHNSADELLAYMESSVVFPEADFLIGRIYRMEGEYALAARYITRAWEHAYALDIPDAKYDILYALADLAQIQGKADEYEKALLLILADDPDYNGLLTNTMIKQTEKGLFIQSLVQSLRRNFTVDKFFLMYRSDSYRSLDACIGLSSLYLDTGLLDKALSLSAFGSVIAVTRIYDVVRQRNTEFTYTTLSALLAEGLKYPDIYDWSVTRSLWKQLYIFARAADHNGLALFSGNLYETIGSLAPESYWKDVAARSLTASAASGQ